MFIKDSKGILLNLDEKSIFNTFALSVHYTDEPTPHEMNLFQSALVIFSNYVIENDIPTVNKGVNILFTAKTDITFSETDPNCGGYTAKTIIYNLSAWRNIPDCNDTLIMAIYLEEMSHMFFDINDEIEVKHCVYNIMSFYNKDFTFENYARILHLEEELL